MTTSLDVGQDALEEAAGATNGVLQRAKLWQDLRDAEPITYVWPIKPYFAERIMDGRKSWELRSRKFGKALLHKRIGIAAPGSADVLGTVYVANIQATTVSEVQLNREKHHATEGEVLKYANKRPTLQVYILAAPRLFVRPLTHHPRMGALLRNLFATRTHPADDVWFESTRQLRETLHETETSDVGNGTGTISEAAAKRDREGETLAYENPLQTQPKEKNRRTHTQKKAKTLGIRSFAVARVAASRAWRARVGSTNRYLIKLDRNAACQWLGYVDGMDTSLDSCSCGMKNLGNTCYGNALLACLARSPSVQAWVSQHLERHSGDATHEQACILCALARDTRLLRILPRNEPFAPEVVEGRRRWGGPAFAGKRQQDAQEALVALLNACDAEDIKNLRVLLDEEVGDVFLLSTPRWKLFGGVLRTQLHCNSCGYKSFTYNMYDHIQLQLKDNTLSTVEALLAHAQEIEFLIVMKTSALAPRVARGLR